MSELLNDSIKHPIRVLIVDDVEFNIIGLKLILKNVPKILSIDKANTGR